MLLLLNVYDFWCFLFDFGTDDAMSLATVNVLVSFRGFTHHLRRTYMQLGTLRYKMQRGHFVLTYRGFLSLT